jgi:hypothetical protein
VTLAEIIHAHEQRTTARPAAAGVITPRGMAAIAAYRLLRQLRELAPEDRLYVTAMLAEELAPTVPA